MEGLGEKKCATQPITFVMVLQAEKEIADARKNVAHEVRLAKEAEAEMDIHVEKAGKIAEKERSKHASKNPNVGYSNMNTTDHAMLEAANGPASTIN